MANGDGKSDNFEIVSMLQMLSAQMKDAANGTSEYSRAVAHQIALTEEKNEADAKAAAENAKAGEALKNVATAGKAVAREFMSIANAGAKLAGTLGTSLTRGTQLELNNRMALLGQLRKLDVDRMATMAQIQSAEKSFVDVFGGARKGMELSAQGAAVFASKLKGAAGGEFTMTAAAMQAMITAGIGGAQGLETFRKATGLRSISEQRMATLVNKNSLSFMLYGPRFAKAANEAEKLGISLSSVQAAQESMVTNLDGTLDTLNQVNQLGANIDFGTLTRLNETEGPEATLKYLQSTIPPSLFQSASTRALLKGFNIPIEDLMKGQQSAQKTASDKIEEQLTTLQKPIGTIAKTMALLTSVIEKVKNSFGPLIVAVGSLGMALFGLRKFGASQLGAQLLEKLPMLSKAFNIIGGISARFLSIFGAGIFGAISGFVTAKKSGRDNYDAAGGALVRGGTAMGGAAIGMVFGGPIGAAIGGFIGDFVGKMLNKHFPQLAASYGAYFKGMMEAFKPLKQTFANLKKSINDLILTIFGGEQGLAKAMPVFKAMGYFFGTVIVTVIQLFVGALTNVMGIITALIKVMQGDFSGAVKTFRTSLANSLPSIVPDFIRNKIKGDDTISRSGYGERSLVTPNGTVALNNRDTVVAFADDAIMDGVRTLSLGSISRSIRGAGGGSDAALVKKVDELIIALQNAKTTININNSVQQVPRNTLAGVTVRNDRI